jgi:uncharacterized membrane protein HdeD (DUF308 family)
MDEKRSLLGGLARWTRHMGWALAGLGLIVAVAPVVAGAMVMVLLGLVMLAAAALIGIFGWRAREAGMSSTVLVVAALAAIAGLVLVLQPTAGLSLIRILLIAYFLLSGLSEVAGAWEVRSEEDWTALLLAGVVSILAAFVLWTNWPISGARAIGLLLGAKLATVGWAVTRVSHRLDAAGDRVAAVRSRLR